MVQTDPTFAEYDINRAVRRNPVTAKFKVTSVSPPHGEEDRLQVDVGLLPDYDDGRNKEWAEYTPAGEIKMVVKQSVARAFPLGQSFTVTFTPA